MTAGGWMDGRGWCGLAAVALGLLVAAPASADRVVLVGGDVLECKVVEQNDTTVVIEHPVLGRLEIPAEEVKSVTIEPAAAEGDADRATPAVEAAEEAEMVPAEGERESKKPKLWSFALDFSFSSVTGNSDEVTLRLGFNAVRKDDKTRFSADMVYYHQASRGTVTDNKLTAGVRHDWLMLDSKWFWFVLGRFDYDEFESWEKRINAQGGPGYRLIEFDTFEAVDMDLDILGGLGIRKEFGSLNADAKLEGLIGLDYLWQINKRASVDFNFALFPVLSDFSDYRARSTANFRYVIQEELNLSLVVGYLLEYQSIVDPGSQTTDFRFFVGIQYAF